MLLGDEVGEGLCWLRADVSLDLPSTAANEIRRHFGGRGEGE
jgi:hypothetical protein